MNELWAQGFLLVFLGFFGGYVVGRRQGVKEGIREGQSMAPLEMRRITWMRGSCVLCGAPTAAPEPKDEVEESEIKETQPSSGDS